MNKTPARALAALAAASAVMAGGGGIAIGHGQGRPVEPRLAQVIRATERYNEPAAAVADGFVPTDHCIASPEGGMGYHYVHPERLADPRLHVTEPEILIYADDDRGGRTLAAVEWFRADADQDLATDDDRPKLLGVDFDGPMPGHEPGMPVHYDLHAWIGTANPNGAFEDWNPAVSCND